MIFQYSHYSYSKSDDDYWWLSISIGFKCYQLILHIGNIHTISYNYMVLFHWYVAVDRRRLLVKLLWFRFNDNSTSKQFKLSTSEAWEPLSIDRLGPAMDHTNMIFIYTMGQCIVITHIQSGQLSGKNKQNLKAPCIDHICLTWYTIIMIIIFFS